MAEDPKTPAEPAGIPVQPSGATEPDGIPAQLSGTHEPAGTPAQPSGIPEPNSTRAEPAGAPEPASTLVEPASAAAEMAGRDISSLSVGRWPVVRWAAMGRWLAIGVAGLWLAAVVMLVMARWIDPPTTAVHLQRRVQSWFQKAPYHARYEFVPLRQISPDLQHAVIAAEDAQFYHHHGFDWHAMEIAADEDLKGGRLRGGSTLTQQLVKNLFFGTGRSVLRKGAEFTLVPVAELVLGKRRILELYLNEVEWGPGVYGAEAACRYYYRTAARNVDREEGARLAAILPAPLKRRPEHMGHYSEVILERMREMGW